MKLRGPSSPGAEAKSLLSFGTSAPAVEQPEAGRLAQGAGIALRAKGACSLALQAGWDRAHPSNPQE